MLASIFTPLTAVLFIIFALPTYFAITLLLIPWIRVNAYKGRKDAHVFFYPILGSRIRFKSDFMQHDDFFASIKRLHQTHPDAQFTVSNHGSKVVFILKDPSYLKEFLLKPSNYAKSEVTQVLRPLLGNGLILAEGSTWKHQRKIISSSFNYEFLQSNLPLIQSTTREFLNKLTPEDLKNYRAINEIQKITGEIVGRIFFGENLNEYTFEGKPLTIALAELNSHLVSFYKDPMFTIFGYKVFEYPILPRFASIMSRITAFRNVCKQIITDKRARTQHQITHTDLLTILLGTQNSANAEYKFTDEVIIDQFVTFFVAGMDTTGHLIGMVLYMLTQHPEYLPELEEERETVTRESGNLSSEGIQNLDLLHCVLKETLRLYTPAPIVLTRVATKDHDLLNLKVKKGDYVRAEFIGQFYDERCFKDSFKFIPKRWKNKDIKMDPYAFTPFSAGPRNCIGQHLSILEAKIILCEFLQRFDFKLKEGYKLRMVSGFVYQPLDDVPLTLTKKGSTE